MSLYLPRPNKIVPTPYVLPNKMMKLTATTSIMRFHV